VAKGSGYDNVVLVSFFSCYNLFAWVTKGFGFDKVVLRILFQPLVQFICMGDKRNLAGIFLCGASQSRKLLKKCGRLNMSLSLPGVL
jgi:hypothetical protein